MRMLLKSRYLLWPNDRATSCKDEAVICDRMPSACAGPIRNYVGVSIDVIDAAMEELDAGCLE